MACAEDAAYHAVDAILAEGGKLLWQKHLEKKAFPFSATTISENLVSHMKMCFVPHETRLEGDDELWEMEPEVDPNKIDSWARMHLKTKPRMKFDSKVGGPSETPSASGKSARTSTLNSKTSKKGGDDKGKGKKGGKDQGQRWEKIQEEVVMDEEEDRYREMKEKEEKKRRDDEAKQRALERDREEARRKLEALHEEMKVRQFTYDSAGNIIWVDAPNPDRLPKVTEQCSYGYKEVRPKGVPPPEPPAPDPKDSKKDKKRGKKDKRDKDKEAADAMGFTDSFTRLKHEQPPIIDTMDVVSGVGLEFQGKVKKGPAAERSETQMSRQEYKEMTEAEQAFLPSGGTADELPTATAEEQEAELTAPGELPPLRVGSRQGQAGMPSPPPPGGPKPSKSGAAGFSRSKPRLDSGASAGDFSATAPDSNWGQVPEFSKDKVVKLPPAPSFNLRGKREAVGNLGRPPRLHLGPLGQTHGFRFPQPVLGATMGHGLLRSGSMKEEFFFPTTESGPATLQRSISEATMQSSFGRTAPQWSEPINTGGMMLPEKKSAAYRNVRTILGFGDEFAPGYSNTTPALPPA